MQPIRVQPNGSALLQNKWHIMFVLPLAHSEVDRVIRAILELNYIQGEKRIGCGQKMLAAYHNIYWLLRVGLTRSVTDILPQIIPSRTEPSGLPIYRHYICTAELGT